MPLNVKIEPSTPKWVGWEVDGLFYVGTHEEVEALLEAYHGAQLNGDDDARRYPAVVWAHHVGYVGRPRVFENVSELLRWRLTHNVKIDDWGSFRTAHC